MAGRILPKGKAPVPHVGQHASDLDLAHAALAAGFTQQQAPTAVAIALAESGGDISAQGHNSNGTVDHGAWQINDANLSLVGATGQQLESNLQINANAANTIFQHQGWKAWSTYNNGKYLLFMVRGKKAAKDAQNDTIGNDIGSAVSDAANAVTAPFTDIAKAISFIFSLQFLYVVGGGILLAIALILIVRQTSAGKGATKAAAAALL